MNHKLLVASLLFVMIFASCTSAPTAIPSPIQPSSTVNSVSIEPYEDVRFKDLSGGSTSLGESLIKTLWFNQSTTWLEPDQQIAQNILQLGMNPGLGIRDLHSQGVTGMGVNVAIIDQNLLLDHPEFKGKIFKYYDVGTETNPNEGSMHGPAVTSLLVGDNIGTAPDAKVYYVAAPSWKADAQYYADALNWIIDENAKLPQGSKIRVVSVSAAPSGVGSPFTQNQAAWDTAYQRAVDADILVLDCTHEHGLTAHCYYDLNDPDNVAKCIPGIPGIEMYQMPNNRISIPTSLRATAEEYNKEVFSYQYTGQGGLSWSIPYLAGVLAMGWQINPELKSSELLEMVFDSAYITDDNIKVINPRAFIDMVRGTIIH